MKKLLASIFISFIFVSHNALAYFTESGEAKIVYPSGVEKTIPFSFSFEQESGENYFSAGKMRVAVDQLPEKYSMALILHKEKYIWVQELAKGYFDTFNLTLGKHQISLVKSPNNNLKGDYELKINDNKYKFENNTVQLIFKFTEKGIKSIKPTGAILDRSL